MARQTFTICGQTFKTKAALEAEAKRIRDAQPIGVPLSPPDHAFIEEVFRQLYPQDGYAEKQLGVGARAIVVIFLMNGRCFQFHLNNGRVAEPSLRSCFQKSLSDPAVLARNAFRFEVFSDSLGYRDAYFSRYQNREGKAPCELSGQLITVGECEVDHIPPDTFQVILEDYLRIRGLTLATVPTKEPPNGMGTILADPVMARDWKAYHGGRARFRVLGHFIHVDETRKLFQGKLV